MRRAILATLLVIAAGGLTPARAAQYGLYAGVSYAQTDREAESAEFAAAVANIYEDNGFTPVDSTVSFDTKDSAYGFAVGYRLFEHLAVEGGYMDLGEVAYRDRSAGLFDGTTPENWGQNIDSSTSGIALSALAVLPLTYRLEVYARAGFLLASNEATVFITDGVQSARFRVTKSGFDPLAGVGLTFSFFEIYNLRLEYMRVFDAGDEETLGEADTDLAMLGITVSF
ncbi:MAG TPA: outer membrane beta-barrel protein [Steroidobacter sp.]